MGKRSRGETGGSPGKAAGRRAKSPLRGKSNRRVLWATVLLLGSQG